MIVFPCHICKTQLSAEAGQVGQLVRCPQCLTTLRVPAPQTELVGAGVASDGAAAAGSGLSAAPARSTPSAASAFRGGGAGKRYGFNCGYCSSRLEATESMAAQEGQCPTCGNNITIPILDRYGRLIDPKTRQIIKQDPHPVHAYAAAGDRAPSIIRDLENVRRIRCPRCASLSPITANNCKACGMPFTMEGTTLEAAGGSNGFCVASLVLGIIGIPASCTGIVPVLAIVFGVLGFLQVSKSGAERGGKGMAIAGIICGVIGAIIFVSMFMR